MGFWAVHGCCFLFFITLLPRITLLVCSIATGSIFWWLGWILCPYILVAVLATISYGETNPFLVAMSWVIALGGTFAEGEVAKTTTRAASVKAEEKGIK